MLLPKIRLSPEPKTRLRVVVGSEPRCAVKPTSKTPFPAHLTGGRATFDPRTNELARHLVCRLAAAVEIVCGYRNPAG